MRQGLNWGLVSVILTFRGRKLRPREPPHCVGLGHADLENIPALSVCKAEFYWVPPIFCNLMGMRVIPQHSASCKALRTCILWFIVFLMWIIVRPINIHSSPGLEIYMLISLQLKGTEGLAFLFLQKRFFWGSGGHRKQRSRFYRVVEITNVAKVVNQHLKTSSIILCLHIYASNPSRCE